MFYYILLASSAATVTNCCAFCPFQCLKSFLVVQMLSEYRKNYEIALQMHKYAADLLLNSRTKDENV